MAKPYVIDITNGTGTSNILNGTYNVSASVSGYENSTINPSSILVSEGTNTYDFTISANGNLTIHVTENGTSSGTPVVGATFNRTDSSGMVYGNLFTTDSSGNAILTNVPYLDSGYNIYFKQVSSDGDHEFNSNVQTFNMASSAETIEITNSLPSSRTINLTDANYSDMPITNGSITLN